MMEHITQQTDATAVDRRSMVDRRKFLASAAVGAAWAGWGSGLAKGSSGQPVRQSSFTIKRVETFKVVVPMKPGSVVSKNYGPHLDERLVDFDKVPKYIIRLHADNGLTGLGETGRGVSGLGVTKNIKYISGKNVWGLNFADPTLGFSDAASFDAFEMAIYDLVGKALGVPVHVLLGGRFQDKIAVTYWTGQRNEKDLVAIAHRAALLGFNHLKFKARVGDPIEKLVGAVVTAVPQLNLGVDFNVSYQTVASFLPVGKRLERFSNLSIEDPIPDRGTRISWLSELSKRVNIPVALTVADPFSTMAAIRINACEMFNISTGSMSHFVRLAYIAWAAGIPCWHGSGVELGIRDMSFIQAAAATRSCTIPSDTVSFLRESDLLANPWKVVNGFVEVPRVPGLGVQLDEDAVRRFQVW